MGPLQQAPQRQQEPGRQSPSPHPPAAHIWLAILSPLTTNSQRREEIVHGTASGHENDEGDRLTASGHENDEGDRLTANGHDDLPDEQGIANAVDVIGSGQKTATGLRESDPKIATDHGRTATEKTTASDALDHSTVNGKRSESENDGHGHESCLIENGLYDPSLFLDPKIGKHRRIENGSGSPKLLSTHYIAERAAMNGEKQPRKRRGQGESAATEQPPSLQLPKELKRQRRARAQQTNVQRHFHPSRWTEVEREERKPHETQHQVHPETSPLSSCPPEGREEEEDEFPGCGTSEEVPARGEAPGAGGTEPEGRDLFCSL